MGARSQQEHTTHLHTADMGYISLHHARKLVTIEMEIEGETDATRWPLSVSLFYHQFMVKIMTNCPMENPPAAIEAQPHSSTHPGRSARMGTTLRGEFVTSD